MTALTWVAASPDGKLLAVGTESGRVIIWSLRDKTIAHTFYVGDFVVRARWTPSGDRLVVATLGGVLTVRSGDGAAAIGELDTRHPKLRDLAIDPRGTAWATCGEDVAVRVWDPQTLTLRFELTDSNTASTSVGFMKGFIVAGYQDGYAVGWTDDGAEVVTSVEMLRPPVYSLGVHPSGERVVYGGGKGGMVEMIAGPPRNWKSGTFWKGTPPRPIAVNAIDFSSDGRFVAAFSDDHARLFKSTSDRLGTGLGTAFYERSPKPEWTQEFIVSGACFIPKSKLVATSHFDGHLRLWRGSSLESALPLGREPMSDATPASSTA